VSAPLSLSDLDLPRRNGELAFDAPWQSTVFALAAAVIAHAFGGDREPFRQQLIAAIAALWGSRTRPPVLTLASMRPARIR
jgi:steroid 5-alpha reductase family enzyme